MDAPEGASEFIDVSLAKVLSETQGHYIVMSVTSYTEQPFVELPECFAGWMARTQVNSGEIYEPATVRDRVDLTANTRISLPLVIDVVGRQVVWCDMALQRNPSWWNNVHGNLRGMSLTVHSLVEMSRPNLYDLFALHARARGTLVTSEAEAERVFSVANAYRQEEVAAQFLV